MVGEWDDDSLEQQGDESIYFEWDEADQDNESGLEIARNEQEVIRLPSGSEFLILSGEGAGSIVPTAPPGARENAKRAASGLRTRDNALSGNVPIYLIQRGASYYKELPSVLARLHATHGENLALGLIVRIPQATARSNTALFDRASAAAIRIADPCTYLLDTDILRLSDNPIGIRARRYAPYLLDGGSAGWIESIVDAQRAAGANLILSPGSAINPDRPQQTLDEACTQADEVASLLRPGERMALNLTLSSRWLSSDSLRTHLLNQLIDQDQFGIIYLRVQWAPTASFAQMTDLPLVDGIKRLANLCLDEGRQLILPQSGLSGWFALAFGSTGFGAGTAGADHAFTEFAIRRRAPGSQRVARYYETQLLHTVERAAHDQLAALSDYQACDCLYCNYQQSRMIWSHEAASLHHLIALGELAAKVQSDSERGGRHGAVRRAVRAAVRYSRGKPLVDANVPRHLQVWDQAL